MLHASPDVDIDVDLQEAMSVHFDESASFDLLKDKMMFPENDSLDADLDMDIGGLSAMKVLEDRDRDEKVMMPIPEADAESEGELDCVGMLEERLRDMNILEEEVGDRDGIISTSPEFSNCDILSQYFIRSIFGLCFSDKISNCSSAGTSTPIRPPRGPPDASYRCAHR